MKLTVLYGQAPELSTSYQTRELARCLRAWFDVKHLELPRRGLLHQPVRLFRNLIWSAITRPTTDLLLYGNDGFADVRHWNARRVIYWYDAPADWSATPPTNFKDRLRCQNIVSATDVFAVSAAQVQVAERLRRGRETSVHYLPVGVDCSFFDPAKIDREAARKRYGIAPGEITIGYLGYLGRHQNRFAGEALLEAAPRITNGNVRYLVIGSGPALSEWKERARALNLERQFIFTGYIPTNELPHALSAADICVDTLEPGFHSEARSETKLKQYMAMARACVATDLGENRVDLAHGRAGVLAPPKASRLAEAIDALIANPAERARLGAAARERAITNYDWRILAQKMVGALGLHGGK